MPKQHADNAGGVAGAWAASVLFMLFGKVAYVFPLMIAWGGWLMFRERDDQQHSVYLRIARWIGFVLTVLSATALASLRMGGLDSLPEGPGGITGDLISSSGTCGAERGRGDPAVADPVADRYHLVCRVCPGWR